MTGIGEIALVSLGAVIGTVWWIVFIVFILPRMFKKYGTVIEDRTVERVKKEIEPFSSKIGEDIDGKVEKFSTGIESKIEGKVNAIIDGYMNDIMDPKQEAPNRFIAAFIARGWKMIGEDPVIQEKIQLTLDRKIDYVINHLIKRIADDPELMKKMLGAWQESRGKSGGGKMDIMGLLQGMMSGQMPDFG